MKYQVIIIGGGPAGYTAAEAAAKGGLSVLLIEKNSLGGVCLNDCCIRQRLMTVQNMHRSMQSISRKSLSICLR